MAPPVAYFMILGLSEISNKINSKSETETLCFPCSCNNTNNHNAISQHPKYLQYWISNNDKVVANEQMKLASQWFEIMIQTIKMKTYIQICGQISAGI